MAMAPGMSKARKMAAIMTGIQFLPGIVLIALAFVIPAESSKAGKVKVACFFEGFYALFIPALGLFGIINKNACLMLIYMVLAIMYMLSAGGTAIKLFMVAGIVQTDVFKKRYFEKDPKHPNKENDFDKEVSQIASICTVMGVLYIADVIFMAIATYFYYKAHKEVKEERRAAVLAAYNPVMTPGANPPGLGYATNPGAYTPGPGYAANPGAYPPGPGYAANPGAYPPYAPTK